MEGREDHTVLPRALDQPTNEIDPPARLIHKGMGEATEPQIQMTCRPIPLTFSAIALPSAVARMTNVSPG